MGSPIVFLYVSVNTFLQYRVVMLDLPTRPFPTTMTLMVAAGKRHRHQPPRRAKYRHSDDVHTMEERII